MRNRDEEIAIFWRVRILPQVIIKETKVDQQALIATYIRTNLLVSATRACHTHIYVHVCYEIVCSSLFQVLITFTASSVLQAHHYTNLHQETPFTQQKLASNCDVTFEEYCNTISVVFSVI